MTEALAIPGWKHSSSGKVRDIYVPADLSADGRVDRLLMVTTDRISAYDYILPSTIPDKGKVLNQLSLWWMDRFGDVIPNHVLSRDVPPAVAGRAVVAHPLAMQPIECVVRGYLTGSGLREYRAGGTVCGVALPAGLTEASKLPEPIFTPAAKAHFGEHDENVSFHEVAKRVGRDVAEQLRDASLELYRRGATIAAERGVLIADTKFEFGLSPETGDLVLGDEVLTPDSSRFWPEDAWEPGRVTPSFDKQYVRDWLTSPASQWDRASGAQPPELPADVVAATRARYIEAFRRLTGADPAL